MPATTAAGRELIPELEARRQAFQAAAAEARELAAGLTEAQFNWRPAPGRWSIAECLDHLRVTGEEILAQLEPAIERAWARGRTGSPPFRYGWLGDWFVRSTGPIDPDRRRASIPSPRIYRPRPDRSAAEVLPAFVALQDRLEEMLRRANGLDLGRVKARSPVTPLLRISLGQWLASTAGHQVRHLEQARAVRDDPAFPPA